jgi:hypothetical protein
LSEQNLMLFLHSSLLHAKEKQYALMANGQESKNIILGRALSSIEA